MPAPAPNSDRGLRRQAIVEALLADIFQGTYKAGEHLVTQDLAVRFGTSHTPIREALIALAGMGVLDLLPNRGATVRRVTSQDVHEICQVRRALECEATRSACGRIALGELHALENELKALAAAAETPAAKVIGQARQLDSRLHDLIAASCGNGLLAAEINRLKLLFRACRDVAWRHDDACDDYHRLAEEAREHLAIVRALLEGDARRASRAMSHHIRSGMRYWSRALPATVSTPPAQASRRARGVPLGSTLR